MTGHDVIVLGTGAAGLTAALAAHDAGAKVGLYEKGPLIGGTSALSGGVLWMPINKYAAAAGVNDTRERALAYLMSLSHDMIDPKLAEAFVDTGPEMIEWLEAKTPLRLHLVTGFPDYHPERPGGLPRGGRSIEPDLFSLAQLGDWAEKIAGPIAPMTIAESPLGGGTGFLSPEELARRAKEKLEGFGRALIASLLKGCLDRGIEPELGARAVELVREGGRIQSVKFESATGAFEAQARHGVVLASGGFEWNRDLVRSFLRGPMHNPPSIPTNTGDGLKMAMKLGASLGNMREAWWIPVALRPGEQNYGEQAVTLILRERTLPRSILVNRKGRRFTNEAANYNALGASFHEFDPTEFEYKNLPCWMIVDQEFVRRYGGLGFPPGEFPAWVKRASNLRDLAKQIEVPPDALEETVRRFNAQIAEGGDPEFGRGESAYDGWSGDQSHYPGKGATLGPLDAPPFYAVEIVSSALDTKGGPRTNTHAAVLDTDGHVIPGLYAAGNVMSAPTGMVYGGAGGTIGPAMVFGYIAGRNAAKSS